MIKDDDVIKEEARVAAQGSNRQSLVGDLNDQRNESGL